MSGTKPCYENSPDELSDFVECNNLAAVEAILKSHSHLANKLYGNRTLLEEPCRRGWSDMVRLLLSLGVSVNNCNKAGFPPIWTAVRYQHAEIVRILVENGADIEMHCMFPSFRCIDYAILLGFYEIALFLYRTTTNKQLKVAEEYEGAKKELKVGRYVNFAIVLEGLQKGT